MPVKWDTLKAADVGRFATLEDISSSGTQQELRAIGVPPHTGRILTVKQKWLTHFAGILRAHADSACVGPCSLPNLVAHRLF